MTTNANIGEVIYDGGNAFADFVKSAEFSALLQQQYQHLWNDSAGTQMPAGSVITYAAEAAPSGWLLCNGAAYPESQYPTLFKAISRTYGGDASAGTFRVPDLRGRVPVGYGSGAGLTARALNSPSGAETHTLSIEQIPSHAHTIDPAQPRAFAWSAGAAAGTSFSVPVAPFGPGGAFNWYDWDPHDHGGNTGGNGSGQSHNNMPPYVVLNYLIKSE